MIPAASTLRSFLLLRLQSLRNSYRLARQQIFPNSIFVILAAQDNNRGLLG